MNISIKPQEKIDIACNNYKLAFNSNTPKFQKLDEWLEKESKIFIEETTTKSKTYKKYQRGQLIKLDFGINIGSELCYTHFAIVITKNDSINSNIITIIPIISKKGKDRINLGKLLKEFYPNTTKYNLICYANLTQITVISKTRIYPTNHNCICSKFILDKLDKKLVEIYTK